MSNQPQTEAGRAQHDLAWDMTPDATDAAMLSRGEHESNDPRRCGACRGIAAIEAEVRADLIERVEGLVPTALHVACQPTEPCVVPVGVITAVDAAIRAAFLQDDKEAGGEPLSAAEELGQEDWPGGPQPHD